MADPDASEDLRVRYPTLHQLAIFIEVVRVGGFSRAAETLLLSQPSVSLQIRHLEGALGGTLLFQRGSRRLILKQAGEELLPFARDALGQLDEGIAVLRELQGLQRGRLRVAADTTAGVYVVPPLLGAFRSRYPGVTISMNVVNRTNVQEQLLDHTVDLAVMGHTVPGADLVATPLRRNRLVVIAPPGHVLVGHSAIPLGRVSKEAFILREEGSGTRASTESYFYERDLTLPVAMELSDNGAIKQAVAAGIGLAVISLAAVELEIAAQRLAVLDVQGFPLLRHWYVVRLARTPPSSAVRAFLDLLAVDHPETEAHS
ncbi:MAG: LysR family transcriptional regulator [Chloroflexota bacterium]